MGRTTTTQHPTVRKLLERLGENIKLARLRRGFSMELVADRAGMSRTTLRSVEQGSASASMGSYANVLHVLGLHEDLGEVGADDELGRKLQDAELAERQRAPKQPSSDE